MIPKARGSKITYCIQDALLSRHYSYKSVDSENSERTDHQKKSGHGTSKLQCGSASNETSFQNGGTFSSCHNGGPYLPFVLFKFYFKHLTYESAFHPGTNRIARDTEIRQRKHKICMLSIKAMQFLGSRVKI